MSIEFSEKARWAKLAGLPKTETPKVEEESKQQLDENVVGIGAINNPFPTRKPNDYEMAFEHFLGEMYDSKKENVEEEEMSAAEKEKVDREVDAVRDDLDQISKLAKDAGEDAEDIKSKIREMIINELSEEMDPEDEMDADEALAQQMDADEYETYADAFSSMPFEESLEEAKEDEEEEIETDESEDTEEIEDEAPEEETEEEPETGGGIEDIAADMKGDEGDLMDHLISALKVSKAMDNDKLTTQIGNTLKFFVGEYIGGEE